MAVSLFACEKKVDLQPTDVIPSDKSFVNVADLELGTVGVYGAWQGRSAVYLSAMISDEARQGVGSEYRGVGAITYRWEYTSDAQDFRDAEFANAWTNMYSVIDRANRVLFYMQNITPMNATENMDRDRLKGELLALRGFAHFELMRWYAQRYTPDAPGVVFMETFAAAPANWKPSRMKSGDVMTKIMADLTEANSLIPSSFVNIGRITKNAVAAMQARVALYINNWDLAIERASAAITVQPLTSISGYPALWTTRSLALNQSSEVIWKLNVAASNIGVAIGSIFQDANGAVQFSPSEKLLNSYNKTNDVRFSTFFRVSPRNFIAKYGVIPSLPTTENFIYDIKMLRTSEMYLIRAEAYAEKNDLVNGAVSLNALRSARITGYVPMAFTSKDLLINEILLERYRELPYEGHRYFDLKRRNLPVERLSADVQDNAALIKLDPTNPKYLLPIPQQEIFANTNIQQNPNY